MKSLLLVYAITLFSFGTTYRANHLLPAICCVCVFVCVFDKNSEKHNDSNAAKWMCAFEDQIIQITEAQPSLCEIMGSYSFLAPS